MKKKIDRKTWFPDVGGKDLSCLTKNLKDFLAVVIILKERQSE
jgi:hypothetical protein